jgi:CDP-diacylglycerol--glycerol-3-phosphate 3-phosphatidyltransferase
MKDVSPNAVSLAAVVFAAAGALCMMFAAQRSWLWLVAPVLFFLRIACNALDGLIAQAQGSGSPRGEIVNEFSDRLSDLLIFGAFALVRGVPVEHALVLLALVVFISYLDVLGQSVGAGRTRAGPFGKADRMLWLGLVCILAFAEASTGWTAPRLWEQVVWVFLTLALLTILNRLARILRHAGVHA